MKKYTSPDTCAVSVVIQLFIIFFRETDAAVMNGQNRDNGNIGQT